MEENHRGLSVPVLDHGFVRLVDYMGSDLSIARNARVSYDAAWRAGESESSDTRLINYLWKNRHTTPFESVAFTFEIKAPIFVLRQWHRHRIGWSYNELSARYKELPTEYYVPALENITTQSADNKQMRTTEPHPKRMFIAGLMERQATEAFAVYAELLAMNCPRELARTVLPVSTYSHMFATVNLMALFHFMELRLHEYAQFEIRVYAMALQTLANKVAPVALKAFRKHTLGALDD